MAVDAKDKALIDRGKFSFNRFLQHFDEILSKHEYTADEKFSIVDIPGFCVIDFTKVARVEVPPEFKHLHRWYEQVSLRPSTGT